MNILADAAAERAVLAGIIKHGSDTYFDVVDLLNADTFTIDSNLYIFKCLQKIFKDDPNSIIDLASINSAAHQLGLSHIFQSADELKHLQSVSKFPVAKENVGKFATKIRKLQIARLFDLKLDDIKTSLLDIKGDESLSHILNLVEEPLFALTSLCDDNKNEPELISGGLDDLIKTLAEGQGKPIGVSTGWAVYDNAIGGGLRKGTFNLIGARTGVGKTIALENAGIHIAGKLDIPVLYMDTEMDTEQHQARMLAMVSGLGLTYIETGKFIDDTDSLRKLKAAQATIDSWKYHYVNISGLPFEEQLAIMRRWVVKKVGLNQDGTAKDCVIIYDYLKLMSAEGLGADMKEYQLLGLQTTALHNFAARYKLPILSAIQLNRDGIDKETTAAASGSDRIIWLCSNFSILKMKSDDEISKDGIKEGNRKLVTLKCRHGAGLSAGDYINFTIDKLNLRMTEGKTRSELGDSDKDIEGFEVQDDQDSVPFHD